MILENIDFNSCKDYIHMERFVNEGSPSGFSFKEKYSTSKETSAKGGTDSFYLCSIDIPDNILTQDYGIKPSFFNWDMLVHPDMINETMFSTCKVINKAILAVPTASSRTIKILDEPGWFIKLNYKGFIGRFNRNIGRNQASSAIEISQIISNTIDEGKLPHSFFFMREVFARVAYFEDEGKPYGWGIVLREPTAYPSNKNIKYHIPAFSLFAKDDKNPSDPTLLTQLFYKQNKSIEDFLFDDIISSVFDGYFELLLNCGLQLECHAQNTLFAIDDNFKVIGMIAKDAESIDKDIAVIDNLKLKHKIKTIEWKCLRKTDYNYQIMHSFMFDFKLGKYLISPIIEDALKNFQFDSENLIQRIKKHNQSFIERLPKNFFPVDGKWYDYANIMHDRTKKRTYISHANPKYR